MALPLQQSQLLSLPDELLDSILSQIPLDAFLACQLTCKRLHAISGESLLWRRHCLTQYRYWRPDRALAHLAGAPPGSINWKNLLVERKNIDQSVSRSLDSIIASQTGRIAKVDEILQYGYDAKDVLLKHLDVDDAADDVLARRYWSAEILGTLERSAALAEWSKLDSGQDVPLERALGAFDLMIAQRAPETLDQISAHLDDLAEQFKTDTPYHEDLAHEHKARMLAAFLVSKRITSGNLAGADQSEQAFRRLQNTMISVALCDDDHPSIPIIAVAIFCCVATRLGLDAHPCAYPMRVLALIFVPKEIDTSLSGGDGGTISFVPLYMDVYDNIAVLPLPNLRQQLLSWGIAPGQHSDFLRPATTSQIVERNARNIQESININRSPQDTLGTASADALRLLAPHADTADLNPASLRTVLNPHRANYAIGWYNIFSIAHRAHANVLMVTLTHLASALSEDFPFDITNFQRYALPFFGPEEGAERASFAAAQMQALRNEDSQPPPVQARDEASGARDKVMYRVGQVFRHRRYAYTGVIRGWDTRCQASDRWIQSMNVDALRGGRDQCFYNVLVEDDSSRYVAEENIEILQHPLGLESTSEDPAPAALLRSAGKYFKRWDARRQVFVSNVRDQYPDD